ncbi:MAG: helix-turn-helix transcriptional regulator [Candidatus Methanoplasma sp.]|jgi:DNA-binding HxlR family transcriptional regulator|nr:helix-turn-helix transcriptional regulator [Candidatus Methanoplasma sp.]
MNHECTMYLTMDYLAKKWTMLILLELGKGEHRWKRFSELKDSMGDVTPKMLSERLRDLEREGLVAHRVDASSFPARSEYGLTEPGRELVDAVRQIKAWALKWKVSNEACRAQDCSRCLL